LRCRRERPDEATEYSLRLDPAHARHFQAFGAADTPRRLARSDGDHQPVERRKPGNGLRMQPTMCFPVGVVRVQIAGVSSVEEALAAEQSGADALGFTVRLPGGVHDDLTEVKARMIVAVLPPFVTAVAITYVEDAREVSDLCRYLGVAAVQLHGPFSMENLNKLRALSPQMKIIKAVHVTGPEAIDEARHYERRVDAIILDTYDRESGRRGATGMPHDWSISREIVERLHTPIILAGGLTPENVVEAIRTVRPWGVDVHTGVEDPDGARNLARIRSFIERAKAPSS